MDSQGELALLHRASAGIPFFVAPGAAATPLSLYMLASHLAPERPFYVLQHTGMDDDQPVESTIEAMSARLVDSMLAVQPEGPYLLGGYCLGGLVAWDAAAALRRRGAVVALLALMETIPPYKPPPDRTDAAADPRTHDAAGFAVALAQATMDIGVHMHRQLHQLPESVARSLRRIAETHSRAGSVYASGRQEFPVALFRARSSYEAVFASWPQFVDGDFKVVTVAGDRGSMLLRPDVASFGGALGAALQAAARHVGCE